MSPDRLLRSCRVGVVIAVAGVLLGCSQNKATVNAGAADSGPSAENGRVSVVVRDCAKCHQSRDPADGVLSGQSTPVEGTTSYGSNLTPDPDTGMDAWDGASIARAVLDGVGDQGRPLCPAMPRGSDAGMTDTEAMDIAAYLQALPPVWHAVPASRCERAVATADAGTDE
jgi:cytochrome c